MIIDCYTHTWHSVDQLGRCRPPREKSAAGTFLLNRPLEAGHHRHLAAAEPVDVTIVLGFRSRYLEAHIPNDEVASYVSHNADRLLGFAGVDPAEPKEAIAELNRARDELGMVGAAVAPAAQDFHPTDSRAMLVYAAAAELDLPLIFHTGIFITRETKLEYAQPVLLDEVAREFPTLKLVIAHVGFPWMHETIALLGKHPNVFAEISWLTRQPWQAYQTLLNAYEFGVIDKLLFGSGFPGAAAPQCIEALYGISHLYHGTNLPSIPREQLRGIVERNTIELLGITPKEPLRHLEAAAVSAEDEMEDLD